MIDNNNENNNKIINEIINKLNNYKLEICYLTKGIFNFNYFIF